MCKIPFLTIALLFYAFCDAFYVSICVAAPLTIEENHLRIIWELGDSEEEKLDWNSEILGKPKFQWWKTGCKNLGEALLVSKGPYGMGVFNSFVCDVGQKAVEDPENKIKWTLWVYEYEEKLHFRFQRALPPIEEEFDKNVKLFDETQKPKTKRDKNILDVSEVEIPASRWNLFMLEDLTFVDLLAVMLLDSLPIAWRMPTPDYQRQSLRFPARPLRLTPTPGKKLDIPEPPEELMIYSLFLNEKNGLWGSEVIGKARLKGFSKKKKDFKELSLQGITWDLSAIRKKSRTPKVLWAHSTDGRGRNSERFAAALAKIHKRHHEKWEDEYSTVFNKMQNFLKASTASGYFGFRYGVPAILSDDPLLDNSTLFSMLLEIRGGPLEGARLYADIVPEVKTMQDEQLTDFSWNKITFGKSWGLGLPYVVDRIDIVPKIGIWNFNLSKPTKVENHFEVRRFDVKNELSLNLEGGLEWISSWYTIRLWGATDRTFSLGKVKGSAIKSTRYGFDTYWIGAYNFKISKALLKLVIIGYGFTETVNITNPKKKEEDVSDTRIDDVEYIQYIWGLGTGLAW